METVVPQRPPIGINFEDNFILNRLKMTLPNIVSDHERYWNEQILQNTISTLKMKVIDDMALASRHKRDSGHPAMMMKKTKKVRTCQNMSGVLGGANAFNFLSFVAGVITLLVNVNNNVNNNNNNLNGISANANNNQNNNANVNNNAANIVIAMPGKKRRKRSDPWKTYFGRSDEANNCLININEPPSELVSLPLVLMRAIQEFYDSNKEESVSGDRSMKLIQDFVTSWKKSYYEDNAGIHSV